MNLENLAEKSPEQRMEAIQTFEEASRKRVNEALNTAEKARKRIKEMRQKWMGDLGTSGVQMEVEDLARVESSLNPQDQKSWERLKKLVDTIYVEELDKLKITKEKPQKSANILGNLGKSKVLKV